MLSFIKVLLFFAAIAALTFGIMYVGDSGTGITFAVEESPFWGAFTFRLGPIQAIIGLLILLAAVWVLFKVVSFVWAFFKFLSGDETALSRFFNRRSERRGIRALSEAITAVAAGEGKTAMTKAAKAKRLLKDPAVTDLVIAQACELTGDKKKAEETYKALLKYNNTRFVGVRGLMLQRLDSGDTDTALKLAEKAFEMKPRHEGVQQTLLQLQADKGEFGAARKTLGAALKSGNLPRDVHRRRDAVLAVSEAKGVMDAGNDIEARIEAVEANRLSPDLVPAAVMAAQSYIETGKPRQATRLVKKAWEAQPHPDLANAFAAIVPNEDPRERVKRFEDLVSLTPDHPEARMLKAELLIAAEDFVEARRAMGNVAETAPTSRSLSIMAAIERGTGGDDSVVRGWLAKAVTASQGPQWVCDNCQFVAEDWGPTCPSCHAFDTLSWREAPARPGGNPAAAAMLPLLVDKPADSHDAPVPATIDEAHAKADTVDGDVLVDAAEEKAS